MRLTERLDHRFHEASARGGACRNWTMVSSGDHLIWCLHLRSRVTERHRLEAPRSEANDISRRLSHVISPNVLIERDKIDTSSLVRYRPPRQYFSRHRGRSWTILSGQAERSARLLVDSPQTGAVALRSLEINRHHRRFPSFPR